MHTHRHKFMKKEKLRGTLNKEDWAIIINRNILQEERVDTLKPKNLKSGLLFEKTIDSELNESDFYSNESQSFFLSFSKNKQELIIFDQIIQKTKSIKASALPMVSDLFNNNKKYLIVTDNDHIICVGI